MIDRFFLSAMDPPAPKMLALPAESTIVERLAAIGDLAPSLPLNVCAKSGNASKEATALEAIAGLEIGSKDWKRDFNLCLHSWKKEAVAWREQGSDRTGSDCWLKGWL